MKRVYRIFDKTGEYWIKVCRVGVGVYELVEENVTNGDKNLFVFCRWDEDVIDLDLDSDVLMCFGASDHLRWRNVTMKPKYYLAPNLTLLREAMSHVTLGAYNSDDI